MYRVAYDESIHGVGFAFYALCIGPIVFATVGAIWLVMVLLSKQRKEQRRKAAPALIFFLVLVAAAFAASYQIYRASSVVGQVSHSRLYVVSGRVHDFTPMPKEGHTLESFAVGAVRFGYSDFVASRGYNKTEAYGGVIHAGSHVRLTYFCSDIESECAYRAITKVEIWEPIDG